MNNSGAFMGITGTASEATRIVGAKIHIFCD